MMNKLLLVLVLALFVSGCSLFDNEQPRMEKNAEQLAAEGASAFMDEDYPEAIKAYTDLKDWYPFSKYAILAELKIADAHFKREEYDEAVVAYENFEKLHPRNDAVPYVINQIGMCWFNRMDTIDRDPDPARNAIAQFKRLLDQFPNSDETQKALKNIEKCLNNLADHELYVADFYLKTHKYPAALKRYQYILETYPGTPQADQARAKVPVAEDLARKADLAKEKKKKKD